MEPNELAKALKTRLKKWSRDFSKVKDINVSKEIHPSRFPLWNGLGERDLVYCVAEVFAKKKWACFFEINYRGKERRVCDVLATKTGERNIWIECKILQSNDSRLSGWKHNRKEWKKSNAFTKDVKRLRGIEGGARAYFVLFTKCDGNPPRKKSFDGFKWAVDFFRLPRGISIKDEVTMPKTNDIYTLYVKEVN